MFKTIKEFFQNNWTKILGWIMVIVAWLGFTSILALSESAKVGFLMALIGVNIMFGVLFLIVGLFIMGVSFIVDSRG